MKTKEDPDADDEVRSIGPRKIPMTREEEALVDAMRDDLCALPEYAQAAAVTPKSQRGRMADRIVFCLGLEQARARLCR